MAHHSTKRKRTDRRDCSDCDDPAANAASSRLQLVSHSKRNPNRALFVASTGHLLDPAANDRSKRKRLAGRAHLTPNTLFARRHQQSTPRTITTKTKTSRHLTFREKWSAENGFAALAPAPATYPPLRSSKPMLSTRPAPFVTTRTYTHTFVRRRGVYFRFRGEVMVQCFRVNAKCASGLRATFGGRCPIRETRPGEIVRVGRFPQTRINGDLRRLFCLVSYLGAPLRKL